MAARELAASAQPVTPQAVLAHIEATPEWQHELQREEFTPDCIASTLAGLRRFGFLPNQLHPGTTGVFDLSLS